MSSFNTIAVILVFSSCRFNFISVIKKLKLYAQVDSNDLTSCSALAFKIHGIYKMHGEIIAICIFTPFIEGALQINPANKHV